MIDIVVEAIAGFIAIPLSIKFLDIFLEKKRKSIWYQIGLCMIYFVVNFGLYLQFHSPVINVITNLAGLILLTTLFEGKISQKLVLISLKYGIVVGADSLCVYLIGNYRFGNAPAPLSGYLTDLVVMIVIIIIEQKYNKAKNKVFPVKYEIILLIIPVLSVLTITYLGYFWEEGGRAAILLSSAVLLLNCLSFYLYYALANLYATEIEKGTMERMIDAYKAQIQIVQESRENLKKLRHDLKHHLIELSAMARKEGAEDIDNYLREMEKFLINPREFSASGNQEIDGVVNYLLGKAAGNLKNVSVNISIPEQYFQGDFYVCTILGNLLENAVREAEKSEEKYLALQMDMERGVFYLKIENSYRNEKHSSFGNTEHGIGLESVKKMIQMKNGEIQIEKGRKRYKVFVFFYITK